MSVSTAENNNSAPISGKQLFQLYGCTNCHGPEGIHPTSRYAPVLKGKPAQYIFDNARAIFTGSKMTEQSQFMHEQFCVGQERAEGCYPIPPSQHLKVISEWLGSATALSKKKLTKYSLYVTSVEAHKRLEKLGNDALFVDVRTRAEIAVLGMPTTVDANIPYMNLSDFTEWSDRKSNFKFKPNDQFVAQINRLIRLRKMSKSSPIFLICRSGSRSAKAANMLHAAGYEEVYSITDGFEGDKIKNGPRRGERLVNGWKNTGLPWSYRIKKEAVFWGG